MRLHIIPWLFCTLGVAVATPAQETWTASLGARAAHAPLVAEIHESAGPEIVVVLTNGQVRAFQAEGRPLWTADLGAPVVQGAQPCLSPKTEQLPAGLSVPTAESIQYLNASTGALAWKAAVRGATWLVSGDLNDDLTPDVAAAGADGSLTALDGADGTVLWTAKTKLTALSGPPALADIDDDRLPEIFAAGKEGVAVFDSRGGELAFVDLESGALCGPVAGDLDDDSRFEVYVVLPGGTLAAYEAETGDVLWETKLSLADTPAPCLAIADLDQDEQGELVIAGSRTCVVAADGKMKFTSEVSGRGPAVADVNSDGELEIVLAGDRLRLLDAALGPVSEAALASPSLFAPVAAAIDGVSLLSIGEDDTLRATRTGARLMPQLSPWPQPRRDATGRAASLSPVLEADLHADGPQLAASNSPLALAGGFEEPATAWQADAGTTALDNAEKASGNASLKLSPAGAAAMKAVSPTESAAPALRRISASLLGKGITRAQLIWERADGSSVPQDLKPSETTPEGWRRYRVSNAPKPAGARAIHLEVVVESADGAPGYIDDVQANCEHMGVPYVELSCNRVGYELRAPKHFTAAATFPTAAAQFRVLDEQDRVVLESGMGAPSRIVGAFNTDWGKFYWRGDLSTVDEPGKYRIEIDIDGNKAKSPVFEIGPDLYWEKLFTPLVAALGSLRADAGSGRAWRSDDPVDDITTVRAINEIYSMVSWRLPKTEDAVHPLLLEIQWGADRLLERTEPGPLLAAALAGTARLLPDNKTYADAARKLLTAHANDEGAKLDLFCASLDLYVATKDESLMAESKRLYPGVEASVLDSLVRYEAQVDDMVANSFAASAVLGAEAEALAKLADNAYGIVPRNEAGQKNLLNTPAEGAAGVDTGNLDQILAAANVASKVYRFNAKPEYQTLIVDQISWILGNNPFGISLFNGLGIPDANGAAGTVSDAIRGAAPGEDRPALYPVSADSELRQTVALLEALANLKRIRTGGVPQPQS